VDALGRVRDHGHELACLLRRRRPGSRAVRSGWRFYAAETTAASDDDPEVHQILIDVSVAAQHLVTYEALRTYASSERRRTEGPFAIALLEGMLDRVARFPEDALPADR
jgi:hypothetical protein